MGLTVFSNEEEKPKEKLGSLHLLFLANFQVGLVLIRGGFIMKRNGVKLLESCSCKSPSTTLYLTNSVSFRSINLNMSLPNIRGKKRCL